MMPMIQADVHFVQISEMKMSLKPVVFAFLGLAGSLAAFSRTALAQSAPSPILVKEFIYETAPFPSCHASTIVETRDKTLLAAWFGGAYERASDVKIWISRRKETGVDKKGGETTAWSVPKRVAEGKDADGNPLPTWNPVLFQPGKGPLLLFYKVGPSPAKWWGMLMTSDDSGATWSEPKRLPDGILGPIKDKPIELSDGTLLCPSSDESDGWKLHMESTTDLGATWSKTPALNEGHKIRQIQPTLLDHGKGVLQFLSRSDAGKIFQGWSADNGKTWAETTPTDLPNPNSGIDAVQLKDGRSLLVFNPSSKNRHPLAVAVSPDGRHWGNPIPIEDTDGPELSYPAVIQTSDGKVHITYTWARKRIRHVELDPADARFK
jgi:predicted neuraminidase